MLGIVRGGGRRRLLTLVAGLVALATALPLPAAITAADREAAAALEGFDAWVEEIMEEWLVPGLGVSVVHDGEVVLARGYGYRDREEEVPVTADTLFAIGSNSKSFTAAILGMLVDDGLLEWDEPIRSYMPGFRMHDPIATQEMTARDLVTHRSGLPRHDLAWFATGKSREELFERLRYLEPTASFRSTFQYQNLMFMTAGLLAERLTGKTWEELVDERIFEPLGMDRANFSVSDMQQDDDFSWAYADRDRVVERIPFRNIDAIGPAGSINSSAAEMAKYVQFHLDFGKVGDEQILSEANARAMQSPQMVMTGPLAARVRDGDEIGDPTYGLGLMVGTYRGRKHVRHGGGIDGFISAMEWLPDDDIGVVVLSNTSGSGVVPTLVARNVFDRLLGMEPVDWAAKAREQQKEAEEQQAKLEEQDATDRKADAPPSHPLADYAATYEHPGYGAATVTVEGERLHLDVVGIELPLDHYHYDVFMVPRDLPGAAQNAGGLKAQFHYDKKGDIQRLSLPLEPTADDIVFERVADEAMKESSFLERMVGEYELSGVVATVALRGDELALTVPGQPTYTLVPDRDSTFGLKGVEGFSVEFVLPEEGAGPATAARFHQPNGTFEATRKEE